MTENQTLTVRDNRYRRGVRAPDHRRHRPRQRPRQDRQVRRRPGPRRLRPGLHQHRLHPQRRHATSTARRASWSTAATRSSSWPRSPRYLEVAYLLIHGELPTKEQHDQWVHEITFHTFVHENLKSPAAGLPLRRAPHGHAAVERRRACRRSTPRPATSSDAQIRHDQIVRMIAKMPTLGAWSFRHAQGKPYVYPDNDLSYTENFLSMLFKMSEHEVRPRPAPGQGPRGAVHPARRPRAELLDQRGPLGRLEPGRPVLGRQRRHRGPLRPAARWRQRGRPQDAQAHQATEQRPGVHRGRQERRRASHGLRSPRLQELRPARHDHQEGRRRRLRGHRGQPAARDRRRSWRRSRSRTSTSSSASSTRTSTSTRA